MRLELFDVRRRWPRQRTQHDDERGFVNSEILFLLPTVQFVGLILPSNFHAEIWTRLHASAISSDIWRSGCVTSASLEWPVWSSSSGNNCHAVHRSLSSGASLWSGTFTLSHIISRAHLRDFFQLLTIGMCHFRYLRNGRCDRHRAEITIIRFIGHSLPVHHFFFYGTARFFNLSHIVSQAVFYKGRFYYMMIVQSQARSTRDMSNYGKYVSQFMPNTIKAIRQYERINKKICRQKMSILFHKICINKEMLPKYT